MRMLLFVGLVVAIWRVSRLLVKDEFPPALAVRVWVFRNLGQVDPGGHLIAGRKWGPVPADLSYGIAYVFTCMWCMSFWVGLVIWALADWRLSVPYPWLVIAAGSGLSGIMTQIESRLDPPEPES
jgi:hypothetical protein